MRRTIGETTVRTGEDLYYPTHGTVIQVGDIDLTMEEALSLITTISQAIAEVTNETVNRTNLRAVPNPIPPEGDDSPLTRNDYHSGRED